eukprot:TRINITY_DN7269_c0_g1_i4.p1 TRINITY_DN7269_c0_g1~~TRINITY_DN7269_c0_g1_i4.p1  ORF type:complete len:284 (+),score=62.42 TRINITY_DN7269_c0_g1_i4:410-1261(+)
MQVSQIRNRSQQINQMLKFNNSQRTIKKSLVFSKMRWIISIMLLRIYKARQLSKNSSQSRKRKPELKMIKENRKKVNSNEENLLETINQFNQNQIVHLKEIGQLKSDALQLNQKCEKLVSENENQTKQIDELRNNANSIKQQFEQQSTTLTNEKNEFEQQIQNLQSQLKTLTDQKSEQEKVFQQQQKELKNNLEEAEKKMAGIQSKNVELQLKIQSTQVVEKEKQIKEYQLEIQQFKEILAQRFFSSARQRKIELERLKRKRQLRKRMRRETNLNQRELGKRR